jgi:tetratricopeptide (TPR) repeat protein
MASAGHIGRAAVHFEEALRIKPDDVSIQHQREKTQAMLMAVNDDIETVNALIAANPSVPDLHLKLGDLLKKKGDMQGAVVSYRTALVHDGAFVPAIKKLGFTYATEGEFERAILAFKEIARLEPGKDEACYWLAGLYAVQKQTDEAIEWLERAVDRGYSDWDRMKNDPKFRNIRDTSYFKKMAKQSS